MRKKKWFSYAAEEAILAFNLFPSDENRKVLELIKLKESNFIESKPVKSDSTTR